MTPGTILSGKYRLVSLLGEGGMGEVWRAEDLRLAGAPVAIKLMHSRDASQPEIRARFEQEVRTAAKLRNPHVAQVYDVGVDEQSGAPFFAMELLEGETLKERLVRGGPLPPAEIARVVSHVAHGLSRAHELGIVHRDLKPANIFLVQNADGGLAKVLDFGIAKRSSHSLMQAATATGMLLGTPFYMSPEQILSSKDVDHRSDIWSLAVIAVEALTGKLPFEADNLPGLSLAICQGRALRPSLLGPVPHGFDGWFERATSLDREQRFATALKMAEALRQLCMLAESQQSSSGIDARGYALPTGRERNPSPASPSLGPLSRTSTSSRRLAENGLEPPPARWRRPTLLAAAVAAALLSIATCNFLREPLALEASLSSTGAEPVAAGAAAAAPAAVTPSAVTPSAVTPSAVTPAAIEPAVVARPAPVEPPARTQVEVRAVQPQPAVAPRVAAVASAVVEPAPAATEPSVPAATTLAVHPTRLTPSALRAVAKPKPKSKPPQRSKPPDAAPQPAPAGATPAPPKPSAPPDGLSPF